VISVIGSIHDTHSYFPFHFSVNAGPREKDNQPVILTVISLCTVSSSWERCPINSCTIRVHYFYLFNYLKLKMSCADTTKSGIL
jgi:hypothetical protein